MTITRKIGRRRAVRKAGAVALVLSLLVHVVLVLIFVPGWLKRLAEQPVEPPPKELLVEAVYEEEPPPPEPLPATAEVPQVKIQPEDADAVPEKAMMVASIAPERKEPTKEPVEPPPAPPQEQEQQPAPPPLEEQSPVILKKKPAPSARSLMMPSAEAYNQMFASADVEARKRARENGKGKRLFKNYERNSAGIKATLSSFGHDVKPGNHTGVSSHSNAFGSYVGMIHDKIHNRWANGYLIDLDLHEPGGSAMNDPKLNTLLEFVIRAEDGELEAVNIVRSSGQLRFDAQAVAVAHSTGPHPHPPPELVSPNGRVYVHWNFWRDQRQCGTFGANVFIVAEQGGSPG